MEQIIKKCLLVNHFIHDHHLDAINVGYNGYLLTYKKYCSCTPIFYYPQINQSHPILSLLHSTNK